MPFRASLQLMDMDDITSCSSDRWVAVSLHNVENYMWCVLETYWQNVCAPKQFDQGERSLVIDEIMADPIDVKGGSMKAFDEFGLNPSRDYPSAKWKKVRDNGAKDFDIHAISWT